MKKIFQKLSILILIFTITSSTLSITADYPTGVLVFSDDITPGNSYTWIIDILDIVGDMYETSQDFYIPYFIYSKFPIK